MPTDGGGIDKGLFGIANLGELQAAGRGGHAEIQPGQRNKSPGEGIRLQTVKTDFLQGAGNDPHHVIKKRISADSQDDFRPVRIQNGMVNCADRGAGGPAGGLEGSEIMGSGQVLKRFLHCVHIQGNRYVPVRGTQQRTSMPAVQDTVGIGFSRGQETGVKIRGNFPGGLHPDVRRQEIVQNKGILSRRDCTSGIEMHHLHPGMNAGIRA